MNDEKTRACFVDEEKDHRASRELDSTVRTAQVTREPRALRAAAPRLFEKQLLHPPLSRPAATRPVARRSRSPRPPSAAGSGSRRVVPPPPQVRVDSRVELAAHARLGHSSHGAGDGRVRELSIVQPPAPSDAGVARRIAAVQRVLVVEVNRDAPPLGRVRGPLHDLLRPVHANVVVLLPADRQLALRGVPEDTIEAAKIDGANPFQMFFRVKLPQIYSTVLVVWTTLVVLVLKVFDIPYALSANDDDKLLLATMMENARNNWSIGGDNVDNLYASIAVMLMLTVVPNMVFNGWRIRREQKELGN